MHEEHGECASAATRRTVGVVAEGDDGNAVPDM